MNVWLFTCKRKRTRTCYWLQNRYYTITFWMKGIGFAIHLCVVVMQLLPNCKFHSIALCIRNINFDSDVDSSGGSYMLTNSLPLNSQWSHWSVIKLQFNYGFWPGARFPLVHLTCVTLISPSLSLSLCLYCYIIFLSRQTSPATILGLHCEHFQVRF